MQIIKGQKELWTKAYAKSWEWMKALMTCLLVLIVPNWKLESHVHIDASNFALGVMLSQNPNKTIDRPIYYARRLMNNVEKNYTTLIMIYAMKKFKHHLLGNSFTFFVDHQALLYVVNKPIVIGQIARWLLLLKEFDFKVEFKLG